MASSSAYGVTHPPRSNPPLRSSSGPPSPCITPSTVTIVKVVSFMVAAPFSSVGVVRSDDPHRSQPYGRRCAGRQSGFPACNLIRWLQMIDVGPLELHHPDGQVFTFEPGTLALAFAVTGP